MKKIAIITRGVPAVGKSLFSSEIAKVLAKHNFSCEICSTNDFFMQNGKFVYNQDMLGENHKKNQEKFKNAVANSKDVVICDNINTEPWEANIYYHLAKERDYKVVFIDFEPNDIEWHIKAQKNKGYERGIDEDTLKDFHNRYCEFKELTDKHNSPSPKFKKKIFNEELKKTQRIDEVSEVFYYDKKISILFKEQEEIKKIIGKTIINEMRNFELEEIKLIPKEYKIIIEEFTRRKDNILSAYDIQYRFPKKYDFNKKVSTKQIERYIDKVRQEFSNIIELNEYKRKTYRMISDYDDIIITSIKETLLKDESLIDSEELLNMIKEDSKDTIINKLGLNINLKNSPLLFKNNIFENIQNKDIFNKLKTAIINREYKNLILNNNNKLKDIKPIKLIFIDNNWYLAYEDSNKLKLSRIAFINKIEYSNKNKFQEEGIKKYINFLKDNKKFQNSMSLYGKKQTVATLKALPQIAKYFEQNMKTFLPSQKFKEKQEDGSIVFTVKYTQPLEILPFIQKWMPDLVILEPQELKQVYKKKLQEAIKKME